MIRKLSLALAISADWLLFDESERGPEMRSSVSSKRCANSTTTSAMLPRLCLRAFLRHQAKQTVMRTQPATARRPPAFSSGGV
jgi:hypothetical protein